MSQKDQDKLRQRKERLAKLAALQDNQDSESNSRSRSREKDKTGPEPSKTSKDKPQKKVQKEEANHDEEESEYASADEMAKVMGFVSFSTSKNKDHSKTSCEAVFKNSKVRRQYRQYMNRRGGFDRKLDKMQ